MTGDYPSLSITDIKVLALTLQLEWEQVGRDHLREAPLTTIAPEKSTEVTSSDRPKNRRKRKPKLTLNSSIDMNEDLILLDPEFSEDGAKELAIDDFEFNEDSLSDDGGEWITPLNVVRHKQKDLMGIVSMVNPVEKDVKVACITNDFAMQVNLTILILERFVANQTLPTIGRWNVDYAIENLGVAVSRLFQNYISARKSLLPLMWESHFNSHFRLCRSKREYECLLKKKLSIQE